MFGQTATINLQNQITAIATTISLLEQQLQQARESKKQLENELQKQLTLIGCGQSALEQAAKFMQMVRHTNDLALESEFWQQLEGMKLQSAITQLPEANDTTKTEATTPDQPTPPDVMEVTTNEPDQEDAIANDPDHPIPNTMPDVYFEQGLESLKVHQLKKLCKDLGITPKRYKNDLLSQLKQWKRSQEGINSQDNVA